MRKADQRRPDNERQTIFKIKPIQLYRVDKEDIEECIEKK